MSKWLDWRRARWQKKPAPDHFIDDDGTFYCDCGCASLAEHQAQIMRRGVGGESFPRADGHDPR